MERDEYEDEIKYRDEEGNIHFKQNNLTNPRYHSDWCSMLYSRLKLAYNLLREDGVIFISIDDNEVDNLKKLCNEIFGEANFEGHIHWRRRHNQPNDKTKMIGLVAEHIICYAKCSPILKKNGVGTIDLTGDFSNPDNDPLGEWASKPWKVGSDQSGSRYTIMTPTGRMLDEEWMGEEKTYQELLSHGRIFFPKGGDGMPRKKYYRFEREEEGQCATNWWPHDLFGHNQGANDCLTGLFGRKNVFSNPKPVELIRGLLQIANVKRNDYVLDYFSGSATCAHAVIQLNAEDDQDRKFIMVQYPEDLDESLKKSDNAKKTIQNAIELCDEIGSKHLLTEIGKERIRRAGEKIKKDNRGKENINNLDIGFRVLKVDSSNMKDVYYEANEYSQSIIAELESNIKEDRSDLDLLYGVLIDWGLPLSLNHKIEEIDGATVHTVDECLLVACFEERITENVVREIAKHQSLRVVFRDSSFANSPDKINVEEIFKLLAPNTTVKVI
jgi:adenine-specific DNA-methyltransferase